MLTVSMRMKRIIANMVLTGIYKREGEYCTLYSCWQTRFHQFRGQVVQYCPLSTHRQLPLLRSPGYKYLHVIIDHNNDRTENKSDQVCVVVVIVYEYKKQLQKIERKVGMEYQKAYKQG